MSAFSIVWCHQYKLTFLALPQFHKRLPPSVAWTKPYLDFSWMHKDDATGILKKNDIHYNLSTGKESVKHISGIVTLNPLQLIHGQSYHWSIKRINLAVSDKQWGSKSRKRWPPISEEGSCPSLKYLSTHIIRSTEHTLKHKCDASKATN